MSAQPKPQPSPSAAARPSIVPIRTDPDDDWYRRLKCYAGTEKPIPNLFNITQALTLSPDWAGVLWYDEFRHVVMAGEEPPYGKGGGQRQWKSVDDTYTAAWLQERGIEANEKTVASAVKIAAREDTRNPLTLYLSSLVWDKMPRVDEWLHDYFGAESTCLTSAIGRCWLVSAVARAFNPGCQADHCMILEGAQGIGKSTGIRALAGAEYFSVHIAQSFAGREAPILCDGVWIMEFSELQTLKEQKVEDVKAFISNQVDRYRPLWEQYAINAPRQCVFAGTTNDDQYLNDETGGRRWWPILCRFVASESLERDRDQIWAEAVQLYRAGSQWHLPKSLERAAAEEQQARLVSDPWLDQIKHFIEGRSDVSTAEILSGQFSLRGMDLTNQRMQRAAKCLRMLGWESYRTPGGACLRRFRPPKKGNHRPSLNPDKARLY